MNPRITPYSRTITNAVGCSIPAYVGDGTIESLTDRRLRISAGDFLYQDADGTPYGFSNNTYIIIGAGGPIMTTEIIKVKGIVTIYGDYSATVPVPDSCVTIELERDISAPIAAGTPFYFCDPSRLDAYTSSLLKNVTAVSATYVDPWGGVGTIVGLDFYQYDTSPDKGRVIGPIMVDATGTEVEITNMRN